MSGSLGVLSIVLLEIAVGGTMALWVSGIAGHVRRGFFLLTGIALTVFAWAAWVTTSNAVEVARTARAEDATVVAVTGPAGARMLTALVVYAVLMVVWQVLLLIFDNAAARAAGILASVAGVVALVFFGLARGVEPVFAIGELVVGALFLGTVAFGFLMGHWYMVERRLEKRWMIRAAWFYIVGVVGAVASVALSARNPAPDIIAVTSPLLAIPGFSVLLGAGVVVICAIIAGFVWKLAHEGGRSLQAATGYMYLALIMAFCAEMAAKFRFFAVG